MARELKQAYNFDVPTSKLKDCFLAIHVWVYTKCPWVPPTAAERAACPPNLLCYGGRPILLHCDYEKILLEKAFPCRMHKDLCFAVALCANAAGGFSKKEAEDLYQECLANGRVDSPTDPQRYILIVKDRTVKVGLLVGLGRAPSNDQRGRTQ